MKPLILKKLLPIRVKCENGRDESPLHNLRYDGVPLSAEYKTSFWNARRDF